MPEILVLGVVRLSAYLQRNIVSLGVVDLFFPAFYIPSSPWGNDRHQRCDAMDGQFEPDLVIAFSSASVADGIRTFSQGYFCKLPTNEWTGK